MPPPPRPVLDEDGSVLPTPAAKAAAAAAMPAQEGGPLCIFCRCVMRQQEPCEALWCGHAFHSGCLREWRVCANKGPEECPHRCHRSPSYLSPVFFEALLLVISPQSN